MTTSMAVSESTLPTQLVDALNALFGRHPGYRAAHAKGIVCAGTFTAAETAASLSRAPHFQPGSVSVTLRFSDTTGLPEIPDGDPNARPNGLALKFHLRGARETDIVAHSYPGFPVGTGEEFLGFLHAIAESGPAAAKPTPIERFLEAHPRAAAFAAAPKPAPESFLAESYYAVHAFRFVARDGTARHARYRIHPALGERHLADAVAAARGASFLFDDLKERLANGPAKFRLVAQLAAPGDPTNDASIAWPDDRPQVELGTLTVTRAVTDSAAAERRLIFDPTRLVDGIELSDDPLPAVRSAVYGVSYARRTGSGLLGT